jgi:hypothetical protein
MSDDRCGVLDPTLKNFQLRLGKIAVEKQEEEEEEAEAEGVPFGSLPSIEPLQE